MGDRTRIVVLAAIVLGVVGGVALWTGVDGGPDELPAATDVFPAPEHWPGIQWNRVEEPALEARGSALYGVTNHGAWLVGWGEIPVPDPAAEGGFRATAALWTSRGGVGWQVHELRLVTGLPFFAQTLAVGPAGYLAFGTHGGGDLLARVASSPDGRRWAEAGRQPLDSGALLVATPTGFVTAGLKAARPMVLSTSDGVAWEEIAVPAGAGDYALSDVHPTADGIIVSGRVQRARDWDGVIWRTAAGGAWDDLAGRHPLFTGPDRGVAIWRTVPFAGGIFALGSAGEVPDCMLVGLVASLGPVIADHCGCPPEAAWTSRDGRAWREVKGPRPEAIRFSMFNAITAGAAGLVAIIEEAPIAADKSHLGFWTSGDGVEWSRIGDAMPGNAGGNLVGLAGRIVVLGSTDNGIAVWVGTPGG